MSEQISVTIPNGNCTNCTQCGLCQKGNQTTVVTDSVSAPIQGADAEHRVARTVVAIDLGTTTIAMYRLDADTGEQLGVFVALNPQQVHGADVLSRICAAADGKSEELQRLLIETLEAGIRKVAKEPPEMIVVAGNTVMQYLLLGYDPAELGVYPFLARNTAQAELTIDGIRTIVMPGISAFIGGDIVSGLAALEFDQKSSVSLLLDLGTNAEMVIGNGEHMLATSAAAGPAFDNKVKGTQLIQAVAALLREGKADSTGCLIEEYFDSGVRVGNTLITQSDIRALQTAKAAIRAGLEVLTAKYGCLAEEVEQVFLSGGFGYYLDLESAFIIGMFPEWMRGRITVSGNTSLEGAYRYAMANAHGEHTYEERLHRLCKATQEMNLAEQEAFSQCFIQYMNFPEDTV